MKYKMFIDDERWPTTPDWLICRASRDCILAVEYYGLPESIAFDHDLGGDDTSMTFIKWLDLRLGDGTLKLPKNFEFSIHSQNPIGAKNIELYMNDIIRYY